MTLSEEWYGKMADNENSILKETLSSSLLTVDNLGKLKQGTRSMGCG